LLFNHQGDFFFHRSFVIGGRQFAFFEGCACLADFGSLWERTDVGSRQQRQVQPCLLRFDTVGKWRFALVRVGRQIGQAFGNVCTVDFAAVGT
jgi:hypothetical protein